MTKVKQQWATVYLKNRVICVVTMALSAEQGVDRTIEIAERRYADVEPRVLGKDIRKAMAAYRVFKSIAEDRNYLFTVERQLAGGEDKIAKFTAGLGAVVIGRELPGGELFLQADRFDGEEVHPVTESVTDLDGDSSDERLGAEALRLLDISLKANGGVSRTKMLAKAPPEPLRDARLIEDVYATVYLFDDAVYFVSMAGQESGLDTTLEVVARQSADAAPELLAGDLRKTLAAYRQQITDKERDRYPGVEDLIAGRGKNAKGFPKGMAGIHVGFLVPRNEFWLQANAIRGSSMSPIRDASLDLPEDGGDERLGAEILRLLAIAQEASGGAPRKKAPARPPASPAKARKAVVAKVAGEKGLAADLEALRFFACADDPTAEYQRVRKEGLSAVIVGDNNRSFHADAEDLAEGGVAEMLGKLAAFFSAMGVSEPEVEDEMGDETYDLLADGQAFKILTPADFKKERTKPGYIWGMAAYRTAQALNSLLEKRGLAERAYAVEGGNDMSFLLITPKMHQAIASAPGYQPRHGPYQLTDRYPNFGQDA